MTGTRRWATKTVEATGKRDARHQANAWEVELREQDAPHPHGTFGDLAEQWIAVKERRWPPNTLQEHRRIVARNLRPLHDVDVAKITPHTLDVHYAELAARGGACTHRPCPLAPCTEHGPRCRRKKCERPPCPHHGACAAWTPCDARRAATARRCLPLASTGFTPSCAPRSVKRSSGAGSVATPLTMRSRARSSAHHDRQVERATAVGAALPTDAYVFSDEVMGQTPWRPDSTFRKYRHLRWWVPGLSESRLHDLRHFMATQLLGAGVDPKVVAQRGGWSKVATMLDRYVHALPVNDRAAADVLGGMLTGDR